MLATAMHARRIPCGQRFTASVAARNAIGAAAAAATHAYRAPCGQHDCVRARTAIQRTAPIPCVPRLDCVRAHTAALNALRHLTKCTARPSRERSNALQLPSLRLPQSAPPQPLSQPSPPPAPLLSLLLRYAAAITALVARPAAHETALSCCPS